MWYLVVVLPGAWQWVWKGERGKTCNSRVRHEVGIFTEGNKPRSLELKSIVRKFACSRERCLEALIFGTRTLGLMHETLIPLLSLDKSSCGFDLRLEFWSKIWPVVRYRNFPRSLEVHTGRFSLTLFELLWQCKGKQLDLDSWEFPQCFSGPSIGDTAWAWCTLAIQRRHCYTVQSNFGSLANCSPACRFPLA